MCNDWWYLLYEETDPDANPSLVPDSSFWNAVVRIFMTLSDGLADLLTLTFYMVVDTTMIQEAGVLSRRIEYGAQRQ